MSLEQKNFEDMKEFIDSLYNPKDIKHALKRNGDEFVKNMLSLVNDEPAKKEIQMLYEYYVENGSELVVNSIFEYASSHNLYKNLEVFPLNDEDTTALAEQTVSELMFYNRKGDEEINIERIEAFFRNTPNAIEIMVEKFRKALEDNVKTTEKEVV